MHIEAGIGVTHDDGEVGVSWGIEGSIHISGYIQGIWIAKMYSYSSNFERKVSLDLSLGISRNGVLENEAGRFVR